MSETYARYNAIPHNTQLGEADLYIGDETFIVSGMTFREMLNTYEPQIRKSNWKRIYLESSEIGLWLWEHNMDRWRRVKERKEG